MSFSFDPQKPVGERVENVMVNGAPLDLNRTYKVAVTDYMAKGGDGKEAKVTAPGVKVGDKMNCDDKGTCTKKLLQ